MKFFSHLVVGYIERGYNPETASNFRYNPEVTPMNDTPT